MQQVGQVVESGGGEVREQDRTRRIEHDQPGCRLGPTAASGRTTTSGGSQSGRRGGSAATACSAVESLATLPFWIARALLSTGPTGSSDVWKMIGRSEQSYQDRLGCLHPVEDRHVHVEDRGHDRRLRRERDRARSRSGFEDLRPPAHIPRDRLDSSQAEGSSSTTRSAGSSPGVLDASTARSACPADADDKRRAARRRSGVAARQQRRRRAEGRQALAQALAPVRQLRRARSRCAAPSTPGRGAGAPNSARRDPADAAVEARLLEDRLREVGPRAVAGGGDVVDAERQLDDARASPPRGARRRSGSRAGRRRPRPRRARRRAAASCGRSCAPSRRRATTSARSTPARRPRPRRAASSARTRRAGSARPTRRTARASPVEDVVGRERDERRAELGDVLRAADVDRRRALRVVLGAVDVRPGRRVQDELQVDARALGGGGSVTSQSARVERRAPPGTPRRARGRAGRPRR